MSFNVRTIYARWGAPAGYREVLVLAVPLMLSSGSYTLQIFIERLFLNQYDADAFAAALPAGMCSFTLVSFFMGVAMYVNAFAAQYLGAERPERAGAAFWQALYFCVLAGAVNLLTVPLAGPLFELAGHPAAVQPHEIAYFRILSIGAFWSIFAAMLEGYYAGIRRPLIILGLNVLAMLLNIGLCYVLIFGNCGFPEMGIRGAGWASVLSAAFKCVCFLGHLFLTKYRTEFRLFETWRFDRELFLRLLRFGLPNGAQIGIDVTSFTVFLMLLGRLGEQELHATNIAIQINLLVYLPLIGFGIAVTTLTGRRIGQGNPALAAKSTGSSLQLALACIAPFVFTYLFTPRIFITPFMSGADPARYAALEAMTIALLRFEAFYTTFDAIAIVCSGALKGAGDTRFVMLTQICAGAFVLVLPAALIVFSGRGNVYLLWVLWTAYICVLACVLSLRFRGGKWKKMTIIESAPGSGLP